MEEMVSGPEEQQNLTLWQRLGGVVASPGATMAVVAQKPTIIWPMVTVALANLAVFMITIPKVMEFFLISYDKLPKQQYSPEELAAVKSYMTGDIAVILAGAAVVLTPLLTWLVYTVIFKVVNLFVGQEAPFKSLYAVSILASVPSIFGSLLRSALVAVSPGKDYAVITTSLAVLLPKGEQGPLFACLSNIDPFQIWSLVVLTIGAAAVMKINVRKVGIVTAVMWLLMMGASVLLTILYTQNPGA